MGERGRSDGIQIGRYLWELFFEGGCWLALSKVGWMGGEGLAYRQSFMILPCRVCSVIDEKASGLYILHSKERGVTVFISNIHVSTCDRVIS